ncbi:hypothetical protein Syun_013755 [Stephania yunnanensis]|uniref:Uncharacterized protein n=1 Tax=Stephania yunnanensis TaxID=152371 RepID=A0AAP0PB53_9MAGN
MKRFRHPRKDKSSRSSQAWRRRKLSGGHCECFEKQALKLSSSTPNHRSKSNETPNQTNKKRKKKP